MELLQWVVAIALMGAAFLLGSFLRLTKVSKVLAVASAFLGRLSDGQLTIDEAKATAQEILSLFKK
jgi:hypothetical protein